MDAYFQSNNNNQDTNFQHSPLRIVAFLFSAFLTFKIVNAAPDLNTITIQAQTASQIGIYLTVAIKISIFLLQVPFQG
jgi:hypothetical protein